MFKVLLHPALDIDLINLMTSTVKSVCRSPGGVCVAGPPGPPGPPGPKGSPTAVFSRGIIGILADQDRLDQKESEEREAFQ